MYTVWPSLEFNSNHEDTQITIKKIYGVYPKLASQFEAFLQFMARFQTMFKANQQIINVQQVNLDSQSNLSSTEPSPPPLGCDNKHIGKEGILEETFEDFM